MLTAERVCQFSPCRRYRYTLWREFYSVRAIDPPLLPVEGNEAHNYLMFIGLNPSTADETTDDPTIRRCAGFAKQWGFGALCMTNLFAFRATDPNEMKREPFPIGEENDHWIRQCALGAGLVLAAWGKHGSHMGRASEIEKMIWCGLKCLKKNKDGSPVHPLYVPASTRPMPF